MSSSVSVLALIVLATGCSSARAPGFDAAVDARSSRDGSAADGGEAGEHVDGGTTIDDSAPRDGGAARDADGTAMPASDAGADAPTLDGSMTVDAGVVNDAATGSHSQDIDEDDAGLGPSTDCTWPVALGAVALSLEVASEPPLGVPFSLDVSTRDGAPLSAAVQVCANGAPLATLQLYRGRGSVSLTVSQPGPLVLQARAANAFGSRTVVGLARPTRRYTGVLEPEVQAHRWTATQDVVIAGTLQLRVADTLTIEAGARVLLERNASLAVAGQLRVQGTADQPVLFTRAVDAAWGEVQLSPGAQASFDHAWFVAGGGDSSREFGHSHSQPVVFVDAASLEMRGGGLIDNPGKAFGSRRGTLDLNRVLISRCDTGGQFDDSQLAFRNLHVLEMPDSDGVMNDDDNDGLYIAGSASGDAGIEATIEDSVFAVGEDDAIDQNGAQLRIERVWIEGFLHEGVACSTGRQILVRDSVVRDCGQGVEAGYGAPRVRVEQSLLTGNGVGARYGDEYSWDTSGSLEVSHSIVTGNDENVRNFVSKLRGPLAGAIQVSCSVVDDSQLAGSAGNIRPPATAPWPAASCSDAALLDQVQCGRANAGPPCR